MHFWKSSSKDSFVEHRFVSQI
ncbi:hypothetical protein BOS5A_200752 [Bosea sp. EC-HK365B]|nr:hypothetical protein BOSE46_120473 [Bosea sp. 46]CAD5262595.1 hypothetical protein BOSE21B_110703 [Bosea sp. 21B]CAD5277829.1 hypothetical protein BOSE7B_40515 [Bosea sp. 7B]VVT58771.1 hypothetical protein BOS5A_200752 [Bosea sp. EC-HK365B]VXC01345.1 hypothetical protein BOSE125_160429 [Bosea sp. 125]VXC79990.1 hypothetical protein BOSE127_50222 [Bosea sp. 127]